MGIVPVISLQALIFKICRPSLPCLETLAVPKESISLAALAQHNEGKVSCVQQLVSIRLWIMPSSSNVSIVAVCRASEFNIQHP